MKTISKYNIISVEESRGKKRIVYSFNVSDRSVIGPTVTHIPTSDDVATFIESLIPGVEEELNRVPLTREQELIQTVFSYPDDVIKSALEVDDTKIDSIRSR